MVARGAPQAPPEKPVTRRTKRRTKLLLFVSTTMQMTLSSERVYIGATLE
jgi:hypothetical protein